MKVDTVATELLMYCSRCGDGAGEDGEGEE